MAIEKGKRVVVGVNRYEHVGEAPEIELLMVDHTVEREQVDSVRKVRSERGSQAVDDSCAELRRRCEGTGNLMPAILGCARAHVTQGEIVSVMKEVFGEYKERPIY